MNGGTGFFGFRMGATPVAGFISPSRPVVTVGAAGVVSSTPIGAFCDVAGGGFTTADGAGFGATVAGTGTAAGFDLSSSVAADLVGGGLTSGAGVSFGGGATTALIGGLTDGFTTSTGVETVVGGAEAGLTGVAGLTEATGSDFGA